MLCDVKPQSSKKSYCLLDLTSGFHNCSLWHQEMSCKSWNASISHAYAWFMHCHGRSSASIPAISELTWPHLVLFLCPRFGGLSFVKPNVQFCPHPILYGNEINSHSIQDSFHIERAWSANIFIAVATSAKVLNHSKIDKSIFALRPRN